jgi:queuine/archaeosine tRNA-ribosyltransferase
MGTFVNFCAGVNLEVMPGKSVEGILVNAAQGGPSNALPGTIELLDSCGASYRACDSGGYQLLKAEIGGKEISFDSGRPLECSKTGINITPWHVVNVFRAISGKVGLDMGVALDFPIKKVSSLEDQEKEFLRKLGYNAAWAIQTAESRKKICPEVPLFIPIQCFDLQQFDLFLKLISGIEFDGFSMPLRNLGMMEIASFLARFHDLGVRKVHLLGTTAFKTIALAAYMARHFFEWVSVDATTWRLSSEVSLYLNPHDLSPEGLNKDVQVHDQIQNDCPCPFCRGKSFGHIKNMPFTERTHFLRCHNFWVTDRACKEAYRNCENILSFERFLKAKASKPTVVSEIMDSIALFHLLVEPKKQMKKQPTAWNENPASMGILINRAAEEDGDGLSSRQN